MPVVQHTQCYLANQLVSTVLSLWSILGLYMSFMPLSSIICMLRFSMMSLHESGIIEHLKARHFRGLKQSNCGPDFTTGSSALDITKVWTVFTIIGSGIFTAAVCLWMETIIFGWSCDSPRNPDDIHCVLAHAMEPKLEETQLSQSEKPSAAMANQSYA